MSPPSHAGPPTGLLVRCRNPSKLTGWYTNQWTRLTGKLPVLAKHHQRAASDNFFLTRDSRGRRRQACELLYIHRSAEIYGRNKYLLNGLHRRLAILGHMGAGGWRGNSMLALGQRNTLLGLLSTRAETWESGKWRCQDAVVCSALHALLF